VVNDEKTATELVAIFWGQREQFILAGGRKGRYPIEHQSSKADKSLINFVLKTILLEHNSW
jgi:hypothetical protein